ncbi:hypothetical protein F9L33_08080 [Amylibacter sp. SFDW26]|uniref:hypothetical protein n=1 Tax=Amylibacter sp. SFDW26 TaxID=2652722 RepID=UPI0012614437|nr:hypothetical protein [Amylibacter sp. SFDW26]KAB7614585.1 hypothetical protein F9L33_08080 [Amylibacter sp. SFDW26]
MRAFIFVLLLPLIGCGGEANMGRLLKQINYNDVKGKEAEFVRKADEIVAQVKAKNLKYLIANSGPAVKRELGDAGLAKYYKEQIFTHVKSGTVFQRQNKTRIMFDENDNAGYAVKYNFKSANCEGLLNVVVISYIRELQIRGISFRDLKGAGCVKP